MVVLRVMMLNLLRQVTRVVNHDVYISGIICMERGKERYKFNKNQNSAVQKHSGRKQTTKVNGFSANLLLDHFFIFFAGNIWRQARVNIPPVLGMSTYRIMLVGIVGARPTGGR